MCVHLKLIGTVYPTVGKIAMVMPYLVMSGELVAFQ